MHARTRRLPRDPLRRARMACDLPVKRHRRLERDEGALRCHPFQKNLILPPRFALTYAGHNFDSCRPKQRKPSTRNERIRIGERDNDARNPRCYYRLDAWRRAPVMRARFERHIEGRPAREFSRHPQRVNLRVRLARRAMPPARDDRALPYNDRADEWIRRRAPARKVRDAQRLAHIGFVNVVHNNPVLFYAVLAG